MNKFLNNPNVHGLIKLLLENIHEKYKQRNNTSQSL